MASAAHPPDRPEISYLLRVTSALFLVLTLLSPAGAQVSTASSWEEGASEERARLRFEDGRLAFAEGRNEVALEAFTESYELSHRAELLYNIGLVHDRLRHDREALEAFRGYVEALPGAENRASVEARIRVLEEEIAREDALASAARTSDTAGEEVWESPVFWGILGGVVVAAGVGIGLGVYYTSDPGTGAVDPGPSGVIIMALGR